MAARRDDVSSFTVMRRFNEGKACDAVIRRIEAREGQPRGAICFPEQERHPAPVELACQIGAHLYAFEHTGIEPFEQHTELEAKAQAHFRPIQEQVRGRLPQTAHFELRVPIKATLPLKGVQLQRMQDSISVWIHATAPTLPVAQPGRRSIPARHANLPDVPFEVSLARVSAGLATGELSVGHLIGDDLEQQRVERIRRAYNKKAGKLAAWHSEGARSVLVLEENDMQVTNHWLVADAVREIEQTAERRPNEVYLLSTIIDAFWSLWVLRVDDHVYEELSVWGDSLTPEINPASLTDLTGR
jgi:hypothetical protein